jgi:hypothetical protein
LIDVAPARGIADLVDTIRVKHASGAHRSGRLDYSGKRLQAG